MDNVHLKKMIKGLIKGKSVQLKMYHVDPEKHMFINALLLKVLVHYGLTSVIPPLETVIHELLSNAYKANLKRVYFSEQKLDASNAVQFEEGIKEFRKIVYGEMDHYHDQLETKDQYMALEISKSEKGLIFKVIDNGEVSPVEMKRISERFDKVEKYDSFLAAYDDFFDESEGAGLGIIMTYFLLKDSGIDPSNFTITSQDGFTEASIFVPFELQPVEADNEIKSQILAAVDRLPPVPRKISNLVSLCSEPGNESRISRMIMSDPSLTIETLKLANAINTRDGFHIEQIEEAVLAIGISDLKMLLLAAGAKKILQKQCKAFRKVWSHNQKTACFGAVLTRNFGSPEIVTKVYLGGLLHDLGKIILLSINDEIIKKIDEITSNRHIRESTIIEEVAIGISHATIGEMIADKWGFPEDLKMIVSRHHNPMGVDDQYKEQVLLAHLADIFWGIAEGWYDYTHIEEDVLESFGIKDEDTVLKLIGECNSRFNECPNIL